METENLTIWNMGDRLRINGSDGSAIIIAPGMQINIIPSSCVYSIPKED